jgi:Ni,Fe-hydrogenase III large subunit/Ni,Fe-hydrogenase III component G
MTPEEEEVVEIVNNKLQENMLDHMEPKPKRVYILVKQGLHREAVTALLENFPSTIISTITGLDLKNEVELNYHLWNGKVEITIRTRVPKSKPEIKTITDIIPGATLYEREVFDLLGVKFLDHPDLKRLILPESWPEGQYPLRKDWNASLSDRVNDLKEMDKLDVTQNERNDKSTINVVFGPQHPALHEPERFLFKLDGEVVEDVEPRLGYAHRGIEKAAEQLMFFQDVHLVERVCGICNVAHTTCFCQAVESLGDIEVPARATYLRTMVHELNRIHSHLLLLGIAGLEVGFESLFQYLWRDREIVLDLMEKVTGNRIMAEYNTIGGVRRDLNPDLAVEIKKGLNILKERIVFYKKVLGKDLTFGLRTKNIGILKKRDALSLSVVGPVARASGVKGDVRKNDPYAAYGEVSFNEVVYEEEDSWARFMVRVDEVSECINIILHLVDNLPSGPYRVRVPRRIPEGEALSRVEAPRGELVHYVKSNGTAYPERVKIRSPTLANISSFREMIRGCNVADIPVVLSSLDPCFSCTDRMAFIDVNNGRQWIWNMEDIKAKRRVLQ